MHGGTAQYIGVTRSTPVFAVGCSAMANAGRHAAYPDAGRFTARVLAAVRRIPPGRVATYGDIASLAGSPRAGRAVGTIMQGCRDGATPCHRVGAGGSVGGWSGPIDVKM